MNDVMLTLLPFVVLLCVKVCCDIRLVHVQTQLAEVRLERAKVRLQMAQAEAREQENPWE